MVLALCRKPNANYKPITSMKNRKNERLAFSWQPSRNIGLTLGSALRKVVALREGGLTQGWVRSALLTGRFVASLQRSQGWRGVVLYLKGCHVLLQQVVGGHKLDNPRLLGCAIARSRTGIPKVIPYAHRRMILSGDTWAVKIWSSFFWLYRVIEIPGILKIKTITSPGRVHYLVVMEWCRWLVNFLPVFWNLVGRPEEGRKVAQLRRSTPLNGSETSLLLSLVERTTEFVELLTALLLPHRESDLAKKIPRKEWASLMKSSLASELQPSSLMLLNSGPNSAKSMEESPGPTTRTNIGSILTDLWIWMDDPDGLFESLKGLWPQAAAFARTSIAQAKMVFEELKQLGIESEFGKFLRFRVSEDGSRIWSDDPLLGFSTPWGLGKLSFIPEPAGKIRVVAMVDSLTQMLLRPLHNVVFGFLRKIPQDGTFDQIRPVEILAARKGKAYWSYDLSAATDRFPVSLQQALLSYLLGPRVARHWTRLLTGRTFRVPRQVSAKQWVPQGTPESVQYSVGQPMGAYTSWAVFALSHHFLVQFAAFQAFGTLKWFEEYALLGDDIVLGNKEVAEKYLLLLRAIGVEVGLAKSLISRRGVLEFAKRTFRVTDEGALVDISGVSLAAIAAAITDSSVMEDLLGHANVRSAREGLRVASRVLGKGYRVRSSIGGELSSMNQRLLGLLILLTRPSGRWGLDPTTWFLQVTAEIRGMLSDEHTMVLTDAIWQHLLASARRLVVIRREFLHRWGNPVKEDGTNVLTLRHIPWAFRGLRAPRYETFLTEWVLAPMLEIASRNLRELIDDLVSKENSSPTEGNYSLDETYTMLNRLIDEFSTVNTELNLFIRRNSEKSDARKMSRKRSAVVKLWKRVRRMLVDKLTR